MPDQSYPDRRGLRISRHYHYDRDHILIRYPVLAPVPMAK